MLRLQSRILVRLLYSPSAAPISPLHRLLSVATPAVSPNPSFTVDEYLVDTCGLTRAQALKASGKLSHLKSASKPDAVLAFLAGLGLSSADVAATVAKDPQLLCASVEKTLAPVVAGLADSGLSHTEIAGSLSLGLGIFRCKSVVSNLPYFMSLFGSIENRVRLLKKCSGLLGCSLEKVVKPNVALLQDCGLNDCDIAKLCLYLPWLLSAHPERVQAMVACAEGLGVPRGSGMFRLMLHAVAFLSKEKIAAQLDYMKNTFRWSDAEVHIAICKSPMVLRRSKDMLQRASEFLAYEVGLEPAYIAHRSVILTFSLEGRLKPRYYVMKFLEENGLVDCGWNYFTAVNMAEKVFMVKYIGPHKEAAPYLTEDYATACRGEVPTRFRFV